MSNQYVPNLADLLPGELARSSDINTRYSNVIAGFDKLPTPLATGQGFSAPVPVGTPTANEHAVTKLFAETTLIAAAEAAAVVHITPILNQHLADTNAVRALAQGDANAAAASATASANSATDSQNSANAAAASQNAASNSAQQAESNYQFLRDRFLGPKTSEPSTDDDGDALQNGAVYYNTTENRTYVYHGTQWQQMATPLTAVANRTSYTATAGQTTFACVYYPGEVDVWLNGIKLGSSDFTATNGTSITLTTGAAVGDEVQVLGFQSVEVADIMTEAETIAYIQSQLNTLVANSQALIDMVDDAVSDANLLNLGV